MRWLHGRRGPVTLAAAGMVAALTLPPAVTEASAGQSFTWSAASGSEAWSTAENWEQKEAPSGSVETLTFPALTEADCSLPFRTTCYEARNDIGGLSAGGIAIDDEAGYRLTGEPITVGAGGITAAPASGEPSGYPSFSLPLTLGAAQTWSLTGRYSSSSLRLEPEATVGGPYALDISLAEEAALTIESNADVGQVTVSGRGLLDLGGFSGQGSLNGTDASPVTIDTGIYTEVTGASVGPLTLGEDDVLEVGNGDNSATLAVDGGLTLGSNGTLSSIIRKHGPTAGSDFSQISATGLVALAGNALSLRDGVHLAGTGGCETLTTGEADVLVTTTGTITGTFAGVPNESIVSLECPDANRPPTVKIAYSAHAVTATVITAGQSEKELEEETAAKRKAEEEAAARKRGEEEAAARKVAEEEAAARRRTEEEALAGRRAQEQAAATRVREEATLLERKESEAGAGTGTVAGVASVKGEKVKMTANSVLVTVLTSRAGMVTISAPGLERTAKTLSAGSHQIALALTRVGRSERRRRQRIKLSVSLTTGADTVWSSESFKL